MTPSIADRESSSMRSLERALHLLFILEEASWPMTVTELGRVSQLSKATVLRILSVLEKYKFAEKKQGRYRLAAAFLPLAHAYVLGNDLIRAASPVLLELAETTQRTASLFIRMDSKRIAVQRVEGSNPMRFVLPIGQRLPLYQGAGKVLAATVPAEEMTRIFEEAGEVRMANGKVLTRESLFADLEDIRRQGYYVSMGERMRGTFAVTAPVFDNQNNTIAAVSVGGPSEKLTPKKIERMIAEVRDAATAIRDRYEG
ncbi:MAG: IclR family transcriptional regulator [Deltaproteobacteria bacterium]|nr:IclR family transcriptional regulator [Deltaproteobacteria bacterium]